MIKFAIFDFDGVFTDGKCHFDSNGNVLKYYDIKDGKAMSILRNNDILTGCISAYSTDSNVKLNDIEIDTAITNQLRFEKVSIGHSNKLDILNEWLLELNIDLSEVAYIGDDTTDIPVLKSVGFSACPNDAVHECKDVVDYVCELGGGKKCVREFVEKIIYINQNVNENNNYSLLIDEIKNNSMHQLNMYKSDEYEKIINQVCETIREININNTIYLTGVGKSKNISILFCNLLKSIGISSHYLDATDSTHGDIGCIKDGDSLMLFSNSGNTTELIHLLYTIEDYNIQTIGICNKNDSKFNELCNVTYVLPHKAEIDGTINKIPSMSLQTQLTFCNIVIAILKQDISLQDYGKYHPGGSIGSNLKTLRTCVVDNYPVFYINSPNDKFKLHDVLISYTDNRIGCGFFIDENSGELYGILTDGDIRRILINNENTKYIKVKDINTDYYYESDINKFIIDCKKVSTIPIVCDKILINVCHIV